MRFRHHPDPDVRHGVVLVLITNVRPGHHHNLIELTRDPVAHVRDWATFGLGSLSELDTPEIRECLMERAVRPRRRHALRSPGRLGPAARPQSAAGALARASVGGRLHACDRSRRARRRPATLPRFDRPSRTMRCRRPATGRCNQSLRTRDGGIRLDELMKFSDCSPPALPSPDQQRDLRCEKGLVAQCSGPRAGSSLTTRSCTHVCATCDSTLSANTREETGFGA